MRAWTLYAAVIVGFSGMSARAQSVRLTEADVLARLSSDSAQVRALRAEIDLAKADVAGARRLPNPRLTLSRESVAGVSEDYMLVTQTLPVSGRRGLEVSASEALLRATEYRTDELLRLARARLRHAFVTLASAQRREGELRRVGDHLRALADVLAKREEAGDAAGFDRLRAEREVLDVEADLTDTLAARMRAQAALAAFFSTAEDPSSLQVQPPGSQRGDLPDVETLFNRALTTRGDLQALEKEVGAARFAQRAAARRLVQDPEIVVGLKTSDVGAGDRGSVLTVQAAIPLFDRGQPEQLRALGRERQAIAQGEVFRIQLRAEIVALRSTVLERRQAAERYGRAASSSDDLERIARVSYDAGERGILELLDAYRSASTARLRQVDLEAAQRTAEIDLEFVSGWELPQ